MRIFHEYDGVIEMCPFCASDKTHLVQSNKRTGKNRKYFPGYKVLCFKCWAGTASYFFITKAIEAWNTRVKILSIVNGK